MNREEKLSYWKKKIEESWENLVQVPLGILLANIQDTEDMVMTAIKANIKVLTMLADMKYGDRVYTMYADKINNWIITQNELTSDLALALIKLDPKKLGQITIMYGYGNFKSILHENFEKIKLSSDIVADKGKCFELLCSASDSMLETEFRDAVLSRPEYLDLLLPDNIFFFCLDNKIPLEVKDSCLKKKHISNLIFDKEFTTKLAQKLTNFKYATLIPSDLLTKEICVTLCLTMLTNNNKDLSAIDLYYFPQQFQTTEFCKELIIINPNFYKILPTNMLSAEVFNYMIDNKASNIKYSELLYKISSVILTVKEKKNLCEKIINEYNLNTIEELTNAFVSGQTFNRLTKGQKFMKLTSRSEIHNRLQIKDGFITVNKLDDNTKCGQSIWFNGLDFVDIKRYTEYYTNIKNCHWLRIVSVPYDATIVIYDNCFTTNKLYFNTRMAVPATIITTIKATLYDKHDYIKEMVEEDTITITVKKTLQKTQTAQ